MLPKIRIIVNYLKEEYPDQDFIVEKLTTIGNNSVFKIGVPFSLYANLSQPNFWPPGVGVRRFHCLGKTNNF